MHMVNSTWQTIASFPGPRKEDPVSVIVIEFQHLLLPYAHDTIFDIKRYTVRRFTLAAYSTVDNNRVNVGG